MPGFSLRNPYLIIAGALIVLLMGGTSLFRMKTDVFPHLDTPAVVVATFYPGMQPADIERNITTRFERFFTLTSGIEHMESRSLPGLSIIKVFFHQGTDPDAAASGLVSLAMADLNHMPPGTLPPTVLKSGAGSLPVMLVTLSGEGLSEAELRDLGLYNLTTKLATVPGASGPPPFGGKVRQIMAYANRQALEARGLTLMSLVQALNSANLILPAGSMNVGDTTAQYAERDIRSLDTLLDIPVRISTQGARRGNNVLLRNIATITETRQPAEADHYNIQRVVDVLISPRTEDLGGIQAALQQAVTKLALPNDVKVTFRGAVSAMQESFANFGVGLMMAVLLLYLVMVAQFRSFIDPVIVLFAAPAGLIGVVATLLATDTTLNIESLMGVIAMIGIVASNSILLVDFANERRRQGIEVRRAIVDAARTRMRPILMTSLATIVGFIPITLNGHEASAPLARAAGGGLAVSVFLTLFLVPAVYELVYSRRRSEVSS